MPHSQPLETIRPQNLDERIQLLASVDVAEAPFLSCYLDLESGEAACETFLERQAPMIRRHLDGVAKIDFDEAFADIKAGLRRVWPEETRGLALFARGLMGGRFFSAIPSRLPFADQMSYYRVPDIRPLLSLKDSGRAHVVLWARAEGVELLRLEGGRDRTLAWVAASKMLESRNEKSTTSAPAATESVRPGGGHYARQLIILAMGVAGGIPLALAGEAGALAKLWNWLPRQLRLAVREQVVLSPFVERAKALRQITDRVAEAGRKTVDRFVNTRLRSNALRSAQVAGPRETMAALRAQALDTLLISSRATTQLNEEPLIARHRRWRLERTGYANGMPWDAGIELSRLAVQLGVRTLVTQSTELTRLGGVGGLLRDPVEIELMPLPDAPRLISQVA
ncbi:MAG: hypothetical protein P8103_10975 [Candidatus Thiodiazotropha sp.]